RLSPEAKLQGRVVDADRKPVAGARVRVLDIAPFSKIMLPVIPGMDGNLNLRRSRFALTATSDADGRFALSGLPREVRVGLRVNASGFAGRTVYAATTDQPQPNVLHQDHSSGRQVIRPVPVHTGALDVALAPGHRVSGQVVWA